MPKYRIELGALVTKYMERTYTIKADNDIEAIEKAKERFFNACQNAKKYTDCDEVNVNDISVEY